MLSPGSDCLSSSFLLPCLLPRLLFLLLLLKLISTLPFPTVLWPTLVFPLFFMDRWDMPLPVPSPVPVSLASSHNTDLRSAVTSLGRPPLTISPQVKEQPHLSPRYPVWFYGSHSCSISILTCLLAAFPCGVWAGQGLGHGLTCTARVPSTALNTRWHETVISGMGEEWMPEHSNAQVTRDWF